MQKVLGNFCMKVPGNLKTSLLACLSVVSLLKRTRATVQIGG